MKEKILQILREDTGYVSGTRLCRELNVSRQAVSKAVAVLRENGYAIASVPNKGYRLLSETDRLYAPDIAGRLCTDSLCTHIETFDAVDSTNTVAKQMAESGGKEGLLVVADKQTAGRGRRGRQWDSAPGVGIWMTLLLRPAMPANRISGLTLLAALALTDALRNVCRIDAQIKWPNDVVLGKKKVCGILTEMSSEQDFIHYVVVGVGINANTVTFPEALSQTATSVYLETGKKVNRCQLIAEWLNCFSSSYRQFLQEENLAFVLKRYNRVLANKDAPVRVYRGLAEEKNGAAWEGIARGIDADGALLVEADGLVKPVVSGEVSVRGMYGYF